MKRNRIRLTESQLHKVIKESVKKVLREDIDNLDGVYDTHNLSVKDEDLRDFTYNILKEVDKKITILQRKYCNNEELCNDLQDLGEFVGMAKSNF